MRFKSPRFLAVLSLLVLAAVPVIFVTSCSKGSINESGGGSVPLATLTPISDCIVDANDDVVVGPSPSATAPSSTTAPAPKLDCADVDAEPSANAPRRFGTIVVEKGGVLKAPTPASGFKPFPLVVSEICLEGGSKFILGSATSPVPADTKLTIIFVGNKATAGSPGAHKLAPPCNIC